MTIDINWNVEKYQDPTEPKHHWELRKKFMETHKSKFHEDKLVSLAKTFTNIEFLGCRYNDEIMKQIEELSENVANDYRKTRETKLKRTFVTASSAAQNKVTRK